MTTCVNIRPLNYAAAVPEMKVFQMDSSYAVMCIKCLNTTWRNVLLKIDINYVGEGEIEALQEL